MVHKLDYLIIGAGPGGLQLGYFLKKASRNYRILERGHEAGNFFRQYPRHRKLLSINKVYTGHTDPTLNFRWDWNSLISDEHHPLMKEFSKRYFPDADSLVEYLGAFASEHELDIAYGTEVTHVTKQKGRFVVTTNGETYNAKVLIVATGVPKTVPLDLPGQEYLEPYDTMELDPMNFVNQRVLILGKGNSAFETAEALIETTAALHLASPEPLKLAWKSHHVGHLRAVNNNFLDTYLLKAQNGMLDGHILKIEKREDGRLTVSFGLTRADLDYHEETYDRVILCSGFRFDNSIFDDEYKPDMSIKGRFPSLNPDWESANIRNLFFAGTVMQSRDFKKTQSSFIHGFRYNIRALAHILEIRFEEGKWPETKLDGSVEGITNAIVDRINLGTALWHQPGFMCDILKVNSFEGARYYSDLPVDYLYNGFPEKGNDYFQISLEYGPDYDNYPFEFKRFTDPADAHKNPQLHPIVRHFVDGELVAVHHVMEELEGNWRTEAFIAPLRGFIKQRLNQINYQNVLR